MSATEFFHKNKNIIAVIAVIAIAAIIYYFFWKQQSDKNRTQIQDIRSMPTINNYNRQPNFSSEPIALRR